MKNNLALTYPYNDLYHSKENRAGKTTTDYIGSELSAANDINIKASREDSSGSSLTNYICRYIWHKVK